MLEGEGGASALAPATARWMLEGVKRAGGWRPGGHVEDWTKSDGGCEDV